MGTLSAEFVELIDDGPHTLNQKRVEELKRIGQTHSFSYTLHAPFADVNIASPLESARKFALQRLIKSLRFAEQLNCEVMVFHPGLRTGLSRFYPGKDWEKNVMSVKEILRAARECNMKVAIENCPAHFGFLLNDVAEFSRFFDEVGEGISLTLDIGHSNIGGQTANFLKGFNNIISHIHAHDNDGKHDSHLGVGEGTVQWHELARQLKRNRFGGIIVVESYSKVEEGLESLRRMLGS